MRFEVKNRKKEKGFSLVEIVMTITIFSVISYFAFIQIQKLRENREFLLGKTLLTETFYLYSQKALLSGEIYSVKIDYLEKKIEIIDSKNNCFEKIKLPKNISYITVYNKKIVENLEIKITKTGNVSPSFSIYLFDRGNQVRYRITVLGFSMIKLLDMNIYRPVKSLKIDYENIIDYNEEFDKYIKEWVLE